VQPPGAPTSSCHGILLHLPAGKGFEGEWEMYLVHAPMESKAISLEGDEYGDGIMTAKGLTIGKWEWAGADVMVVPHPDTGKREP